MPPAEMLAFFSNLHGDETVVVGRFRVVEDLAQLGEVFGTQQVGTVADGLVREQDQAIRVDLEDVPAFEGAR